MIVIECYLEPVLKTHRHKPFFTILLLKLNSFQALRFRNEILPEIDSLIFRFDLKDRSFGIKKGPWEDDKKSWM